LLAWEVSFPQRESQLAIEYCYRFNAQHPDAHIIWQHIGTFARAFSGWSQLARQLAIPGHEIAEADTFMLVKEYLSDTDNGPWLLVLDNADDADVLLKTVLGSLSPQDGQQSRNLVSCLLQNDKGKILITTRDRRVGERLVTRSTVISVSSLEAEEAMELLKSRLPEDYWDEINASKITRNLEYLPLSITQAAALISQNNMSMTDYV